MECLRYFKYLGAWVDTTLRDIKVRIALPWAALRKMNKIWSFSLNRTRKIDLFKAIVEYMDVKHGHSTGS